MNYLKRLQRKFNIICYRYSRLQRTLNSGYTIADKIGME